MREINKKDQKLSYSGAKEIYKSIADYEHYLTKEREDKPAFNVGRAFDTAISEPETWGNHFAVLPEFGDMRKKENKDKKAKWEKENEGKTYLKVDEFYLVKKMHESVFKHPFAAKLLTQNGNQYELDLSFEKKSKDGDIVPCHGRFDVINKEKGFFADIKTTQDACYDGCMKAIGNFKYYWQAYFYEQAYYSNYKKLPHHFFIFVQKSKPYTVTVIQLSEIWLTVAGNEMQTAIDRFALWKYGRKQFEGSKSTYFIATSMPAYLQRKEMPEIDETKEMFKTPIKDFNINLHEEKTDKDVESQKVKAVQDEPPISQQVITSTNEELNKIDVPDPEIGEIRYEPPVETLPGIPKEITDNKKKLEQLDFIAHTKPEKIAKDKMPSMPEKEFSSFAFEFTSKNSTESQKERLLKAAEKFMPGSINESGGKYAFRVDFQEWIVKNDLNLKSKKDTMNVVKVLESEISGKDQNNGIDY